MKNELGLYFKCHTTFCSCHADDTSSRLLGILLSLVIGVICAVITTYKVKSLTWLVKGYIELSRNTPLLIQVFFLYFGLSKIGLKLDGFTCGIIGLAFLGGSYMAEAIRGGLEAVSKGQIESALSIGLTPFKLFAM